MQLSLLLLLVLGLYTESATAFNRTSTFLTKCTSYFSTQSVDPVPTSLLSLTITEFLAPTTVTVTPSIITPAASTLTVEITVIRTETLTTTVQLKQQQRLNNRRGDDSEYAKQFAHKGVDAKVYPRETASVMYPTQVRCAVLVEVQDKKTKTATAPVSLLTASTIRTTTYITVITTRITTVTKSRDTSESSTSPSSKTETSSNCTESNTTSSRTSRDSKTDSSTTSRDSKTDSSTVTGSSSTSSSPESSRSKDSTSDTKSSRTDTSSTTVSTCSTISTANPSKSQSESLCATSANSATQINVVKQTAAPSATYNLLGCLKVDLPDKSTPFDVQTGGTSSADNMTVEDCASLAGSDEYFGLIYGYECLWSRKYDSTGFQVVPESQCNSHCTGSKTQACGAESLLQVYSSNKTETSLTVDSSVSTGAIVDPVMGTETTWTYRGCYSHGYNESLGYYDTKVDAEGCANFCYGQSATSMSLKYGNRCRCGFQQSCDKLYCDTECQAPCIGNSNEACGADYFHLVYTLDS